MPKTIGSESPLLQQYLVDLTVACTISQLTPYGPMVPHGVMGLGQRRSCNGVLTTQSHYPNLCWLIINGVSWFLPEGNFIGNISDICPGYEWENYQFGITAASPSGQWVKVWYATNFWSRRSYPSEWRVLPLSKMPTYLFLPREKPREV